MKKLFSIFAATMFAASMMATGTVFTYSDKVSDQTKDGFTVKLAKGKGDNEPKAIENYNTKKWEVRLYAKNTITVSGKGITRVDLTFSKQGSKDYASLSASKGDLKSGGESTASDDKKVDTWTGSADEVVFTIGDKGQRVIYQIVVNGDGSEGGGEGEGGEGEGEGGEGGNTVQLSFKEGEIDSEYFVEDGSIGFYLYNFKDWTEEGAPVGDGDWLELWLFLDSETAYDGTFTVKDNTFDAEYSYLTRIAKTDTTEIGFVDGTVTIKVLESDEEIALLNMSFTLVGDDDNTYTFSGDVEMYLLPSEEQAIENINVEPKQNRVIMHEGQLYIIRDGKVYGVSGARVK